MAGERTALAWVRMGLALLAIPGGLMAYTVGGDRLAFAASTVAAILGAWLLLVSLRTRAEPARASTTRSYAGGMAASTPQVLLTSATALVICLASLLTVLRQAR